MPHAARSVAFTAPSAVTSTPSSPCRLMRPKRSAQARPDVGLARCRDEGVEVARLVELAALNDGGVAEDIAQGLAQSLAAVDHPQHAPLEREPAPEQVLQQLGADHGILRRAQAQAQRDLAAFARDPQDDDHRLLGHNDTVHEQRHHLEPFQAPRQLLLEALPGPPHHCPTDGALAAPAAAPPARPRFETGVVLAGAPPPLQLLPSPPPPPVPGAQRPHPRRPPLPPRPPPPP